MNPILQRVILKRRRLLLHTRGAPAVTTYAKAVKAKWDAKGNCAEVMTMKAEPCRHLDQRSGKPLAVVKTARPPHLPE